MEFITANLTTHENKNAENKKNISKKNKVSTPEMLIDGTICFTKAIRYPKNIFDSLRELCYTGNFTNMSETIFYCLEQHEKNKQLNDIKYLIPKKEYTTLTVRFRENHKKYIDGVCKRKGLNTFSDGVNHVLFEFLKAEERL